MSSLQTLEGSNNQAALPLQSLLQSKHRSSSISVNTDAELNTPDSRHEGICQRGISGTTKCLSAATSNGGGGLPFMAGATRTSPLKRGSSRCCINSKHMMDITTHGKTSWRGKCKVKVSAASERLLSHVLSCHGMSCHVQARGEKSGGGGLGLGLYIRWYLR